MSFNFDDQNIGGQLKVGTGICPAIGEGATKVNGSALVEGPIVLGNPTTFPLIPYATVNIAPLTNSDVTVPPLIPGSLCSGVCLLYTSPSPRDVEESRMPSSA